MFTRIVLAVDDSDARVRAVATVADLARRFGASVHVLHLAPTVVVGTSLVTLEDNEEARRVLDESVRVLREAGVEVDGELVDGMRGQVPEVISDAVKRVGADLVVLSPHHRGIVASWFNPSVSDAVGHASHVPVLLVPDAA
ncbi:universal stress protein [Kitasatospora sp. NPDC048407]|uniref:universal stress protein n=1 Tax=Kitasatospora sp. NPDC048407 TaxID=3364051 RepID=UPI003715CB32